MYTNRKAPKELNVTHFACHCALQKSRTYFITIKDQRDHKKRQLFFARIAKILLVWRKR